MAEVERKSKRKNKGPWKAEVQARRRADAEARQAITNALSPQTRLESLDRLGFNAIKERAKLAALISGGKK